MPKFMLVLYESEVSRGNAPQEVREEALRKYTEWRNQLSERGLFLGSERLTAQGRVLKPNGKEVRITDGPYAESKEVFAGYWALDVASFEEAVECCRNSPHLEYGGTIEIREVSKCPVSET